jgi:integrase
MGRREKGTGGLYQRASDGMWCIAVELPSDGKRRRKVIARAKKSDAVAALRAARQELERNGDLITATPTLEQWLTGWLDRIARPRLKPKTFETYSLCVNRHINPSIGRVRLDRLTPAHVRRMHAYVLDQGLSSSTALTVHRVLAKALSDAQREGRIGRNVATLVDAPRRAVSNRGALTAAEARTLLLSVADDPIEAVQWSMALLTGLRRGERLGVTRPELDLDAGVLTVSWQLQELPWRHGCGDTCERKRGTDCPQRRINLPSDQEATNVGGSLWLTRPKSRAGWRQVPLAPMLIAMLERHLENTELGPEQLVFTRADGKPIRPSDDTAAWTAACKRARVPPVPLHSARHTTATLLYELGVPEQTRVAILGHSSATTTAGYTHVSDPLKVDAMDRLGGLLALD